MKVACQMSDRRFWDASEFWFSLSSGYPVELILRRNLILFGLKIRIFMEQFQDISSERKYPETFEKNNEMFWKKNALKQFF